MSDLISRQALKKSIEKLYRCDWKTVKETMNIAQVINDLPSAEPEPKWIPVTEGLPEDGERVLITHRGGVSFGWYNGVYWERGASTYHRPLQTVIAWMPLPEPYRGE